MQGKTERSFYSSALPGAESEICIPWAAWAQPADPRAVREFSAPTSQSSFQSIHPLVEVSFKARHERGLWKRSADLEHLEFLKHSHCLCLEIAAFIRTCILVDLGPLSSASYPVSFIIIKLCLSTCQYCYYKAIIFNNYNNAPGLKSQLLRDLSHLLPKAPTMSYGWPRGTPPGQLGDNSLGW